MPLFEMPIEKMLTYEGTNPRPDDHGAYWERALTQMRAKGTGCELVPAPSWLETSASIICPHSHSSMPSIGSSIPMNRNSNPARFVVSLP